MVAVKSLVIGMGALIVVGLGLLVYGLAQKATNPDFRFFGAAPASAPSPVGAPPIAGAAPAAQPVARSPWTETLHLGQNCLVAEMIIEGGRIFLREGGAKLCDDIHVIDAATGVRIGSIHVETP